MKIRGYLVILYGILLVVGGFMGYLKAGSIYSAVAGGITGIISIILGVGMLKECVKSLLFARILTGALSAFFLYRFLLTYAFMPAGMMCIISLILFIGLVCPCKCKGSSGSS